MSAGTGIRHSEYNHSSDTPVHFLQIWILPDTQDIEPGYEQKDYPVDERKNQLRLVASRNGRGGSLTIHQDVDLYSVLLDQSAQVTHPLRPGRRAWVQVAYGSITLNGAPLGAGDGAAIENEDGIALTATADSEILLFDMI